MREGHTWRKLHRILHANGGRRRNADGTSIQYRLSSSAGRLFGFFMTDLNMDLILLAGGRGVGWAAAHKDNNPLSWMGFFVCCAMSRLKLIHSFSFRSRFYDECKRRFNIKLWKTFTDCFNCLPVAAIGEYWHDDCDWVEMRWGEVTLAPATTKSILYTEMGQTMRSIANRNRYISWRVA